MAIAGAGYLGLNPPGFAAGTVALAFGLYDFGWTHALVSQQVAQLLDSLSLHLRFGHFAEGIVRLSDLSYFAGLTAITMATTRMSFELRRVGA